MAKRRRKNKPGGATRRDEEATAMVVQPALLPLADEVAEDIFLRLPIKSLAASRCVSPSWNTLLSSAEFADRHHATRSAAAIVTPTFVALSTVRVFCGAGKACHGAVLIGRLLEGTFHFHLCNPSTGGALLLPPRRRAPWVIRSARLATTPPPGSIRPCCSRYSWASRPSCSAAWSRSAPASGAGGPHAVAGRRPSSPEARSSP